MRRSLLLGFVAAALALSVLPQAAAVAATEPVVSPASATATPGTDLEVTLAGWPTGVVTVVLCGGNATTPECAMASSVDAVVTAAGTAQVKVPVVVPPAACPCVVSAWGASGATADAPIGIVGAPVAEVVDEGADAVPIQTEEPLVFAGSIALAGGDGIGQQFGFAATRVLGVVITNVSDEPSEPQEVEIVVGRNAAVGAPLTDLAVPALEPGESFEDLVTLEFHPFDVGRSVIFLAGFEAKAEFEPVVFDVWPFGLGALIGVAGSLIVAVVRRKKFLFTLSVGLGITAVVLITGAVFIIAA